MTSRDEQLELFPDLLEPEPEVRLCTLIFHIPGDVMDQGNPLAEVPARLTEDLESVPGFNSAHSAGWGVSVHVAPAKKMTAQDYLRLLDGIYRRHRLPPELRETRKMKEKRHVRKGKARR